MAKKCKAPDPEVKVIAPEPWGWRDTTRPYQMTFTPESEPITPREYTLDMNNLSIILHRRFGCAGWFFTVPMLGLAARSVPNAGFGDEACEDPEMAKRLAFDYVDRLLEQIVNEMDHARKDLGYHG